MTPDFVIGIKWYLVFLFSTAFHEAAHAWAAFKLGDDTAYRGGQVTLDPTPHLRREPIGMVVVPILSYLAGGWMIGWASAPYNATWALQHPRRSAGTSLAGPAANVALVLLAATCIRVGMATALVAGGIAAKLGLFKGLWVAILAGKKFVIMGIVALAALLKKFFGKANPTG